MSSAIAQPAASLLPHPEVRLGTLTFAALTEAEAVAHIASSAAAGQGGWVVTPNVDILRLCASDASIRSLIQQASLTLADGMPLIWASKLQGTPLPERVCGSNIIWSLSEAAASSKLKIFMIGGGTPTTADRAGQALRERYPDVQIVGSHYPPFGFEKDEAEVERIAAAVRQAEPNIIYVALSVPKTERLIERIRHAQPDAWWVGVGISFSFICGEVERAPKWMQRLGLEWVHRLLQEPRRLIGRYLLHDVPFALRLLAVSLWRRLTGTARRGEGGVS